MLPGQGRTTTKHVIWLAILFVILLLPLGTHEARRSRDLCQGSEGDDAADCAQSPEAVAAAASGRRVAPRRAKFKFHKIQRLDDDDDDNDNEDGDDENDNDNGSDEDVDKADEDENDESSEKANANDDDDDDDDDEANADDNDGDGDDDDAEDADDEEDNDDDDGNDETADDADDEEPSLLQRIMNIFTSDADTEQEPEAAKESPFQLSNIIDWLQSLTEQAVEPAAPKGKKESKKAAQKVVKSEIDWLTYLKRWPFNSIFPEPAAPAPTRRTAPSQGSASGKAKAPSKATSKRTASQSEEYLELLIHSLPAFFGNVSEAKSGECHQQLELLHRQLRAHKLWTFQSKPQTRSPAPAPSYSCSFLSCSARCNRQDRSGSAAWEYQSVW